MSIIVRGEEKSIMIFNTNTSDTAIFTGKELEVLKNWFVTGKSTPFIKRLKLFNLVDERNFDYWLNEIEKSTNIKAPLRSM